MELAASVDEVLDAAVDLIEIASTETELLRAMRPGDIAPLMEEKVRIASFYHDLLRKVEKRRDGWIDLPEDTVREIEEVSDWVKLIVSENARLLRASMEANERMLTAIKEAAEETSEQQVGLYLNNGAPAGKSRQNSAVTVSLGVDTRT